MRRYRMRFLAFAFVLVPFVSIAHAGTAPRTFVASTGVDSNPCSRPSPCRSFSAAVAQTASGGSVIALDSAGYGPVTIAQSISLIGPPGVYAGITATAGDAITISGAAATDVVLLRGLSIEGAGGANGISVAGSDLLALQVESCMISGFTNYGVYFQPGNSAASLFVGDSTVSGCDVGIRQYELSSLVNPHATIDHVRAERNNVGFWMTQTAGAISNSVASGNAVAGFAVDSSGGRLALEHCVSSGNGIGVRSENQAIARVANCIITDNAVGLSSGSVGLSDIFSLVGDSFYQQKTNTVENNLVPGSFTGTYLAQ